MKTTIVIEDGRVTVQVDDQQPISVKTSPLAKPPLKAPDGPVSTPPAETSPPAEVAIPIVGTVDAGNGDVHMNPPADDRKCEICEGPLPPGSHKLVKVCSDECRKKKQRAYAARHYQKKNGKAAPAPQGKQFETTDTTPRLADDAPPAKTSTRSKCCEAKVEVAGGEDEPNEGGTRHYVCLACMNACDTYEYTPPFDDPWDCGACREISRLCRLHHSLEQSGHTPPKFRHAGVPPS